MNLIWLIWQSLDLALFDPFVDKRSPTSSFSRACVSTCSKAWIFSERLQFTYIATIFYPFATHCRYHDLGPRPTSQNAAAFSIPTPAPMSWTKRISPKRVTHHDSSWSIIFLKPLINVLGFPPKIFLMGGKQFEYFECSWLVLLTSVLDVIESCFKNGSLLMHARILAPFSLVVILVHLSSFVTRIFPPLAGHREQAWGYLWEAEVRQRRLQNLLVNHLQEPGASGWEPWIYTGRKGSICSILLEFNLQ